MTLAVVFRAASSILICAAPHFQGPFPTGTVSLVTSSPTPIRCRVGAIPDRYQLAFFVTEYVSRQWGVTLL